MIDLNMTNILNTPPQVGDKIILGDWHQFKSWVSCVEDEDGATLIHVTIEYPDDPFFTRKQESAKVYLHDEGKTWHRVNSYPYVN